MIINMVGGSGGASVYVKSYATKEGLLASTANENTIGVVTASPVSDFYIQSTAPAHAAGRVYIHTGTSGNCSLNIGNNVTIYPLYARISNGNTWTSIPMYVRKGGAWVTPNLVLMENKVKVNEFTKNAGTSITVNGLDLSLYNSSATEKHCGYLEVDLTDWRKLYCKIYTNLFSSYASMYCRLGITDTPNTPTTWINYTDCRPSGNTAGEYEYEFDLTSYSNTSYVQILVSGNSSNRKVYVQDWYLKA